MQESPLFSKLHDFALWLLPLTTKFPREHRLVMAAQLQQCLFALQRHLFDASHGVDVQASLRRADARLAQLRSLLRLCVGLTLVSPRQLEHAAQKTAELGRLLGGWQRSTAISSATSATASLA